MKFVAMSEPRRLSGGRTAIGAGLDRRAFVATALGGPFALALGTSALPSIAHASSAHTFKLGTFEITVLSDGNLIMPTPFLATNVEAPTLRAAIAPAGQTGDRVEPPCNITLVRTPSEVVLIDTGAGAHYMPTAGKLMANMQAAGIRPESITKVVFTHAHPDHLWGTLDDFDDSPHFPNASYLIAEAEWNFWAADDAAVRLPENRRFFVAPTRRNLVTIKEKIRTIKPGDDIAPGIRAVDTAGHTAGHIAVEVASGNDAVLVVGDALAHPVIAFAHPEWKPAADHHDADQAINARKRLLDRMATDRSRLIGFHLPFPGVGRVARKGSTYAYVSDAS